MRRGAASDVEGTYTRPNSDQRSPLRNAVPDVNYDEMVIVRSIDYRSVREHQLLPFLGQAHVAAIPNGKADGLSKIPRIGKMFARRLQAQERMTQQTGEFLQETLHPKGVAWCARGAHVLGDAGGEEGECAIVTSAILGIFKTNHVTRAEFLRHLVRGDNSHGRASCTPSEGRNTPSTRSRVSEPSLT